MYDRYKNWVPDNSGVKTSPPTPTGVKPEDFDDSSLMPDHMGPLTKDS